LHTLEDLDALIAERRVSKDDVKAVMAVEWGVGNAVESDAEEVGRE